MAVTDRSEMVETDDAVLQLEQVLLGFDGKESPVRARVKAWLLWFGFCFAYLVIKRLLIGEGFTWDVPVFALIAAKGLMKIVTPEKPIKAHMYGAYHEARRLIVGLRFRRTARTYRVAPYALLGPIAETPRSWSVSGLLTQVAAKLRRNRTDA